MTRRAGRGGCRSRGLVRTVSSRGAAAGELWRGENSGESRRRGVREATRGRPRAPSQTVGKWRQARPPAVDCLSVAVASGESETGSWGRSRPHAPSSGERIASTVACSAASNAVGCGCASASVEVGRAGLRDGLRDCGGRLRLGRLRHSRLITHTSGTRRRCLPFAAQNRSRGDSG